jgi:hypothetical protein
MNTRMFKLFFILLISALSSCIVVNSTSEAGKVCKLHHKNMRKTLVRTCFGYAAYSHEESPHAKRRENMGCVRPRWPAWRLALIYHCSTCDSVKRIRDNINDY